MDCQKHVFSLDKNHHYLNCSYLSPLPKPVEEAGVAGLRQKKHPWEVSPEDFFTNSNRLRSLFGEVIHAETADSIAILPAVSYGLAAVAKNLDPQKGKSIVVTGEQFPSNVFTWRRFCKEYDCSITVVEPPEETDDRGKRWNRRILDAIDNDTLAVALGSVHWTDGTLFDLKAIGQKAREVDAYFVIDGTQSIGAMPFDVQQIKPDALICAGYKWLMGPYSMTLGYFGPRLQNGIPLEEGWITRKGSEDFSSLIDYSDGYQAGARRFDVGERSNFILVPMMIEALKLILRWEPQNIREYCKTLTLDLVQKLPEYGYQIEDENWRGHHMFGIRLPDHVTKERLQLELDKHQVHLSVRGSAIRISPNVYNDQQDIETLLNVLKAVSKS